MGTFALPFGLNKINSKTELLNQLGDFGPTADIIDRLLFVLDQTANVQAGLSQFVHNSCLAHVLNAVQKHTFRECREGDEEDDGEEQELRHVQL